VFLQYFDTVAWVLRPVKTVARITYTVLVETLNPAQSINDLASRHLRSTAQLRRTCDTRYSVST